MEMVLDASDIVFFMNVRTVISPKESESPVSEFSIKNPAGKPVEKTYHK